MRNLYARLERLENIIKPEATAEITFADGTTRRMTESQFFMALAEASEDEHTQIVEIKANAPRSALTAWADIFNARTEERTLEQ